MNNCVNVNASLARDTGHPGSTPKTTRLLALLLGRRWWRYSMSQYDTLRKSIQVFLGFSEIRGAILGGLYRRLSKFGTCLGDSHFWKCPCT